MKKQILTILLIICVLSVAGCSNKENNDSAQNEKNVTENNEEFKVTEANVQTVGTPIKEQCFDVTLDEWGMVTFASYAPANTSFQPEGFNPDVRFYLKDGDNVLYEFPGWNEEHTNADLFLAVSAIAFKDYNDDGLLDVITLCEYETMSGEGFQTARIYFQLKERQGFEEDTLLTEYLSKNYKTDSITTILEAKEEYWDYKASLDGHRSFYNELTVIAENKEMWTEMVGMEFPEEAYQYTIADLDRNGRYEIIVSGIGGTGIYTYSRFFEINENYDGLVECDTDFVEGDSQPDLISEKLETYIDDEGGLHYAVYDLVKNGAAEYHENVRELILQEGKIVTKPIAYKSTIYNDGTPTVTCTDLEGNVITEEEYENAAKNYFAGYQEGTTNLGWQDVRELGDDVEEIRKQLDVSFNKYIHE